METIIQFFQNNQNARIILDTYLIFIIILFCLRYILKNKKIINLTIPFMIIFIVYYLGTKLDLTMTKVLIEKLKPYFFIAVIVILAPELRKGLDFVWKSDKIKEIPSSSNDDTKKHIADAVEVLAKRKIGAIITIEKHNSLDQYAQKAVVLNSDVSRELLITIFHPMTPLHDGAVIIRGNKIRAAAAYYVLTEHDNLDKTVGSRHRAALGISEKSDSLTIVVSEQTGTISIAVEGIMLKMNDKEKLLEYINMFIK